MKAMSVLAEYEAWLEAERDTPAKRWCLVNPPTANDLFRAVRIVQGKGLPKGHFRKAA